MRQSTGRRGTAAVATPGVLGMVTFHAISFIIESYDSSPPAALFRLPPGAKITKPGRG
jgi:hypothetical protein